jgi:hypothetical protein
VPVDVELVLVVHLVEIRERLNEEQECILEGDKEIK